MHPLLDTPIEFLKGVGPHRGDLLRKEMNIHKYGDLINFEGRLTISPLTNLVDNLYICFILFRIN
jgi:hypothetical protein